MRIALAAILALAVAPAHARAQSTPEPGDRIHITGCEGGQLMLPVVNLWSGPGGGAAGARVVGHLAGDGRADQGLSCQGSVVIVRQVRKVRGRAWMEVETVVGSQRGWLTTLFAGREFDTAKCAEFFRGYPEAVRKCAARS